jgi:hypothetical protein
MQPFTHSGSLQWRQDTAKLTSPFFSIFIFGLILTFFSARAISFSLSVFLLAAATEEKAQ